MDAPRGGNTPAAQGSQKPISLESREWENKEERIRKSRGDATDLGRAGAEDRGSELFSHSGKDGVWMDTCGRLNVAQEWQKEWGENEESAFPTEGPLESRWWCGGKLRVEKPPLLLAGHLKPRRFLNSLNECASKQGQS